MKTTHPLRTLLLLSILASCSSSGSDGEDLEGSWKNVKIEAPSDRVLWKISLISVERMGFPLAGGLDPASGEITSGWKNNLHPFAGEGYRIRALVRMEPVEAGIWKVQTRVRKETNEAIVDPLDPSRAEWEEAPDDEALAAVLLQHIAAAFDPQLEFAEEEEEDPVEAFLRAQEKLEQDQ